MTEHSIQPGSTITGPTLPNPVYSDFLRLPRIRFLLADDPAALKTIMAGLLLKELKARGLVCRVLIVTPARLTFQWQREMSDKFREEFEGIRGDVLRADFGPSCNAYCRTAASYLESCVNINLCKGRAYGLSATCVNCCLRDGMPCRLCRA